MHIDDHGRGGAGGDFQSTTTMTTTLGILERLKSFMRFVQTVFFRAIDQICRNGCGRRRCRYCRSSSPYLTTGNEWPAEPEINDVPLLPSSTTTTTSPDGGVASHRKLCWDFEEEESQCLNGGSCFAIELHNGMRRSGCSCPPNWTGDRCEMRYIDPVFWDDSDDNYYRTASISTEVFLLIIAIFVFLSAVYIYLRHQRSRGPNKLSQSTSCPSCPSICSHLHTAAGAAAAAAAGADGIDLPLCCKGERTNLLVPSKTMADVTLLPLKSYLLPPKSCPAFRDSDGGRGGEGEGGGDELFPPKGTLSSSAEHHQDGSSLVNNYSSNHRNLSNKGLSRKTSELPTSTQSII